MKGVIHAGFMYHTSITSVSHPIKELGIHTVFSLFNKQLNYNQLVV